MLWLITLLGSLLQPQAVYPASDGKKSEILGLV